MNTAMQSVSSGAALGASTTIVWSIDGVGASGPPGKVSLLSFINEWGSLPQPGS